MHRTKDYMKVTHISNVPSALQRQGGLSAWDTIVDNYAGYNFILEANGAINIV